MTEAQLQTKVLAWLRKQPGTHHVWHKLSVSHFGHSGWPDIIGCHLGRFVAIELKNESYGDHPERGLTVEQEMVQGLIRAAGGAYLCANSLAAVQQFFRSLG
jgi:hypothetical protein